MHRALRPGVFSPIRSPTYSTGMFIIRHRLPSGDLSAKTDVRLLRAISAAQELREAGRQDITITPASIRRCWIT
jgi:hypothetical protein